MAWIGSHELDPGQAACSDRAAPLEVQVVSLDWKWLFIYPEQGVASVNQLVVPAGVPLHFSLTSASVMNAFFVPQLGSMIYTMNGMVTQLNLQADETGHVPRPVGAIQRRRLFRHALRRCTPCRADEFAAWVQGDARSRPDARSPPATRRWRSRARTCRRRPIGAVDPELFQPIVDAGAAARPGPATERGGAAEASHAGGH